MLNRAKRAAFIYLEQIQHVILTTHLYLLHIKLFIIFIWLLLPIIVSCFVNFSYFVRSRNRASRRQKETRILMANI